MNEIKTTEQILALNTTALRAYAKEIGVARAANDTKATLAAKVITAVSAKVEEIVEEVVAVTPIEATTEEALELLNDVAAQADYAAKVKAAKKAGKCTICFTRAKGTGKGSDPKHAKSMGYCAPCLEEAEWENEHSDAGHEVEGNADEACWICHPELNEAQKEGRKAATSGRSRIGMKIWAKGTYIHKSSLVADAIKLAGGKATVKSSKGGEVTVLNGEVNGVAIKMTWTGNAFEYGEDSTINAKQVRNVAAALRVIASLKK